ncbi:hypothetical protein MCC93_19690 [Morococcus cerebrosus]|uniref:Uncharacterized protein n=2 Tax=Neisseriaceae TaxID=481 RepID=A0A0C1ECS7_9NEIS|nr:hypothetical protein HMPREF1051_0701 [Neisseria sicca VK64]KIC06613.1 hypothetical protein MCC93_19690 [Morococcus cerebrosus]
MNSPKKNVAFTIQRNQTFFSIKSNPFFLKNEFIQKSFR